MDRLGNMFAVFAVSVWIAMTGYGTPAKLIADMETECVYTTYGEKTKPNVSISAQTAAQGNRSLCFEHSPQGKDRGDLVFPVDGAEGLNAITFDIFCEKDNGGVLIIVLRGSADSAGNLTRYKTTLNLCDYLDGWYSISLVKDKSLAWGGIGEPDWSKISSVTFSLSGQINGQCVYYLDNVRFEKIGAGSVNMLYNSSFEIATNPDVPDGWSPQYQDGGPYGPGIWAVDPAAAYLGVKSLRIGYCGKRAVSWRRHTYLIKDKDYTFSIYLKSNQDGVKAALSTMGIDTNVFVTTNWQRYAVTWKAAQTDSRVWVSLCSDGVLWMDAAQLEVGTQTTAYTPAEADSQKPDEVVSRVKSLTDLSATPVKAPQIEIQRAVKPPRLDGRLDDPCWEKAAAMTPFVTLTRNEPAPQQTIAKMCYDDQALYVAVAAQESDMKAVGALMAKKGDQFWNADLIELFLDLNHDKKSYYHFAANVRGERYVGRHTARELFAGAPSSWSAEWETAVTTNADGWTLEMKIPYTCFDLRPRIRTSPVVGVNVTRENPRTKEHCSWAFSHGNFHTPEAFGEVTGLNVDFTPYRFEVTDLEWDQGVAQAAVGNHTGVDRPIKIEFLAKGVGEQPQRISTNGAVKADGNWLVSLPLPIKEAGAHQVLVKLYDQVGRDLQISQPIEVVIKTNAIFDLPGTEFDFYTHDRQARARCFIGGDQVRCQRLKLKWWLERDGRPIRFQKKIFRWWFQRGDSEILPPRPGINEWTIPLEELPAGDYDLIVALQEEGKSLAKAGKRFRKLLPPPHEVRINRWGRFLVCDGKPFLWYGFYHGLARNTAKQQWVKDLQEMKSAHCTAVLVYVAYDGFDEVGWALDQAQALGLKLWIHVGSIISYIDPKYAGMKLVKSDEEALVAIRNVINQHKDHPALLGWCTLDEPGNRSQLYTRELTQKYYRFIKELDPYHPCIFSHLNRIEDAEYYGDATDWVQMPFTDRNRENDRRFQSFWDKGLPISVNAHCYGALANECREPTPQEERVRMYKALILGARGFCTYTYRCASQCLWNEFCRIGNELETLKPVLLAPDDRLRVEIVPKSEDVYALLKAMNNDFYLIAVNTALKPVEIGFRLMISAKPGGVQPLFDSPAARYDGATKTLRVSMNAQHVVIFKIQGAGEGCGRKSGVTQRIPPMKE